MIVRTRVTYTLRRSRGSFCITPSAERPRISPFSVTLSVIIQIVVIAASDDFIYVILQYLRMGSVNGGAGNVNQPARRRIAVSIKIVLVCAVAPIAVLNKIVSAGCSTLLKLHIVHPCLGASAVDDLNRYRTGICRLHTERQFFPPVALINSFRCRIQCNDTAACRYYLQIYPSAAANSRRKRIGFSVFNRNRLRDYCRSIQAHGAMSVISVPSIVSGTGSERPIRASRKMSVLQ